MSELWGIVFIIGWAAIIAFCFWSQGGRRR